MKLGVNEGVGVYVGKRVRRVGVTGSWWLVLFSARAPTMYFNLFILTYTNSTNTLPLHTLTMNTNQLLILMVK